MTSRIQVGTQGWNYEWWKDSFFPRDAKQDEYLTLYSRVFDTVEVDSTFYAIPPESSVLGWSKRTGADFTFSLKLPRSMTHEGRLRVSQDELELFCTRARLLGPKLGIVLVQLPPDYSPAQFDVLAAFLPLLPRDMRFAIEFRDRNWVSERSLELLGEFNVAFALVDSEWIPRELSFSIASRPTANFAYLRWLGPRVLTDFSKVQINKDRELGEWADVTRRLESQVDAIFGYFDNHYQGHSPSSANRFKQLLGQEPTDPSVLVRQPSLF